MADSGSGYQVSPADLDKFADYLNNTTVSEIKTASSGVQSANGGDVSSFGVALGQVLGIPCRIALAAVHDQLNSLADKIGGVASDTKKTGTTYSQNDTNVAGTFQKIQGS